MDARKMPWWGYLGWVLVGWVALSVVLTSGGSLETPVPWAMLLVGVALGIAALVVKRR